MTFVSAAARTVDPLLTHRKTDLIVGLATESIKDVHKTYKIILEIAADNAKNSDDAGWAASMETFV